MSKLIALITLVEIVVANSVPLVYENYSFNFSEHKRPIAYQTLGNALELNSKIKLNPRVANRGGAIVLDTPIRDKTFTAQLEFTMQSDLDQARGLMILLTQHEITEEEIDEQNIGIKQNF